MLLAALPRAVGRAREYTRWVLGTWHLQTMVDTVELLVSELVTNAVTATGVTDEQADLERLVGRVNPVYLCLTAFAETLLIEVGDTSTALPRKRAAADDDEAGRGLILVQALSKEWGCEALATGEKIVWAECVIVR